jgi:hypothetical protein
MSKSGSKRSDSEQLCEPLGVEPVAWMDADGNISDNNDYKCFPIPLYTTPYVPTKWRGLTDEDKSNLWLKSRAAIPRFYTYATLVEAKLKELNT